MYASRRVLVGMMLIFGFFSLGGAVSAAQTKPQFSHLASMSSLNGVINDIKVPSIQSPEWLKDQEAAEQAALSTTVTYSVETRGLVTANLVEFKQQANATLNDKRGWSRLGAAFQEVASGGSFSLVLSQAEELPNFSSGCSAEYSCNVGRYVIINQDKWLGATSSWNGGGGLLRDYRHMVVNHETGHWLGHQHESCNGVGQAAAVMQQQSIDLQGCAFNPWPLASEIWSTRLGIDKR